MNRLNLGILAHVDAGKTTLTERLLHAAGVIDAVGSVDAGTTQTDSMPLERQRGITIRSAVAAFTVDDVAVNLIDTPGHPDFIAEVDRSLTVLDGAVLVVSAVEGVQPQTVVLLRALHRLRVPTLIFVNKIDRAGADPERVVTTIRDRLSSQVIMMGTTRDAGTGTAAVVPHRLDDPGFVDTLVEVLADRDEALLRAYVDGRSDAITPTGLASALAAQTRNGTLHPILFGSAITGAGVGELMTALTTLLPTAGGDQEAEPSGSVFKVERRPNGEKVAYVRMVAGRVSRRQHLQVGASGEATVTAVRVFEPGGPVDREEVVAGQIATLSGLRDVRVGDSIGTPPPDRTAQLFAPPTLETGVVATDPAQQGALHAALAQLAEQDPLINLRQDDQRGELYLSLFGEVQKEVIEQTLAADFGVAVDYHETTVICVERPVGTGHAVEVMSDPANPFCATIGLTVEPGPVGSGLELRIAVESIAIPLYVYKNLGEFRRSLAEYLTTSLRSGLRGWAVTDCVVTLTECGYEAPSTTAADVRKLTPLVVLAALQAAGTVVCEPIHRFHLDAPLDTLSAVLQLLGRHRAVPQTPSVSDRWFTVDGDVPAAEIAALQRRLPGRSHGEGVLEVSFDRYEPYPGSPPTRPLDDHHPLHRQEYLAHLSRRG